MKTYTYYSRVPIWLIFVLEFLFWGVMCGVGFYLGTEYERVKIAQQLISLPEDKLPCEKIEVK
jgi:hypothetical protein